MIEIIKSAKDLPALAAAWEELTPTVPMLLHEWVTAAAFAFHSGDELCVMLLRDAEKRLAAVAPLVRSEGIFGATLGLMGSHFLFEPSGLIFRDLDSLKEMVGALLKSGIPLQLNRLMLDENELSTVSAACGQRALHFERFSRSSPVTQLHQNWEAFEQTISSKRRSDLRRAMRHAQNLGNVEFEVVAPTPETHAAAFSELLEIEDKSWKERQGTAISRDKRYENFFGKFTELASKRNLVRVGFMRIGGKPAAFNLAVQFGGAMWVLKIGYREEFSKCSPGVLLMHEMVKYACNEKLQRFEFLGTDEPWLHLWSPEVRNYNNLRVFPLNFSGACQLGVAASGYLVGKMRRMFSAPLRSPEPAG